MHSIQIISKLRSNAAPQATLTFSSLPAAPTTSDTNGVVYFIGTDYLTAGFTNPHTSGKVVVTRINNGQGNATQLVSRAYEDSYSGDTSGSWISIDLGAGRSLKVNHYVLCGATTTGSYLRSWKLQGSDDNSNWTDLDTQTSNATINGANQAVDVAVAGQTIFYRYLRILLSSGGASDGSNYLVCSEFEFYGILNYT